METIDINTVMAGWFGTFILIMGIIAVVVVVGAIVGAVVDDPNWLGIGVFVLAVLCIPIAAGWGMASDNVEPEEMIRIQQEVERISGEEVTLEEVDQMLDGDPVRDVYYIHEGDTLIVEKGSE